MSAAAATDSPTKKTGEKKKAATKKSEHPKYIDMICDAIVTLKDRKGSSRQKILRHVCATYKVGDSAHVHVKQALKKGVTSGALRQVKGAGASGSFSLPVKQAKVPKKKPAAKKPAAKKAKKPPAKKAKKPAAKKPAAKKPAAKKPAAKKAAKKPAAKKPAAKKLAPTKKGKKGTKSKKSKK